MKIQPFSTKTINPLPLIPGRDFHAVYDSLPDALCILTARGSILFVNAAGLSLFNYGAAELLGFSIRQFVHPQDQSEMSARLLRRTEALTELRNRFIRRDGTVRWLQWQARWDARNGWYFVTARDVTEAVQVEKRLLKAQKIARLGNYEFDMTVKEYSYVSETVLELYGLDKQKLTSLTSARFWSLVHPDDYASLRKLACPPPHATSDEAEFRIVRPDGETIYLHRLREFIRDKAGRHIRTIGVVQDITERKINELARRKIKMHFKALVQHCHGIIVVVDSEEQCSFVGESIRNHLGYDPASLMQKNFYGLVHPDDVNTVRQLFSATSTEQTNSFGPVRMCNEQGEWRWMEATVSNHMANPVIAGWIINAIDVTSRIAKEAAEKRNVEELRKLSMVARETINPVIVQSKDRRVVWVNDAFINLSGYTVEECLGKFISEICDGPKTDQKLVAYVNEKLGRNEAFRIEALNYKKNGEVYWSDISCQPVFDESGAVVQYFSIATDITERKRLQEKLESEQRTRHNQVAAATLRAQENERSLVSQELHDNVNQVLTTVKLYVEMCRDGVGDSKEILNKSMRLLQDSINEIRSLSKRLSAPSLGRIRLSESVRELLDAVSATNRFALHASIGSIDHQEVSHDMHLAIYRILQEHLTNILKHAGASRVDVTLQVVDGSLAMEVSDNGKGFDTATKSSGIGIDNMTTRAESLCGLLSISSTPGAGCKLTVNIPLEKQLN